MERDRDDGGRARNARPRDATGRPLTRDAAGTVPAADPDRPRTPDEALDEAQRLLDAGRPYTAHEVLETAWKAADRPERPLWQGLAQLAVGLTHAQRGNAVGAAALLERGAERIAPFAVAAPYGVDVTGLVARTGALVGRIRSGGLDGVTDDDRRPRLR